nr:MFS transporter [Peribacillus muralis]
MASFMTMLDSFIVNVAVPSIQEDLQATSAEIQFVIISYILSYGVLLITGGRLGDIYGVKKMFITGMAGFTIASLLCGIASTVELLIVSRILQGIAAALMVPQVISYIQVAFPLQERQFALTIYGAVIGIATVFGQIAGGILLKFDLFELGWRSIFLINIPIGLLALVAAVSSIQLRVELTYERIDLSGVSLLSLSLLLFMFPVVIGRELGWPYWTFVCFVLSIVIFLLFLYHEKKLTLHGGNPLIHLTLLKDRAFTIGLSIVFAFFSGNAATFFILSFYLQESLRFTALEAAFAYTPLGIGFLGGSLLVPKISSRFGDGVLRFGSVLMVLGISSMMATIYFLAPTINWQAIIPAMFVSGIGQGFVATPLIRTILSQIKTRETGMASGLLSTVTVIAQGVGVSLIGTLYFSLMTSVVPSPSESTYSFTISLLCILCLALVTGVLLFLLPGKQDKIKN